MSENKMADFELQLLLLDNRKIMPWQLEFWIVLVPGVVGAIVVGPDAIGEVVVWPNVVSPDILEPAVVEWDVVWTPVGSLLVLGSALVGPEASHVIVGAIVIVPKLKYNWIESNK